MDSLGLSSKLFEGSSLSSLSRLIIIHKNASDREAKLGILHYVKGIGTLDQKTLPNGHIILPYVLVPVVSVAGPALFFPFIFDIYLV
jgi:hypothetical protein